VDIAREVAAKLPASLKCFGVCEKFAPALVKALQKEGVSGTRIIIRRRGVGIADGRGGGQYLGANVHQAVRVGDTLFDNLNPGGIPYQAWRDNLTFVDGGIASAVTDAFVRYIPF